RAAPGSRLDWRRHRIERRWLSRSGLFHIESHAAHRPTWTVRGAFSHPSWPVPAIGSGASAGSRPASDTLLTACK
ncbi:MAG: hypothetical protein ACREUG_13385, partial [Steroidobacteraceae bacterium]